MIERVIAKAKSDVKTIVFPEGNEERTILAAEILKKEGFILIILNLIRLIILSIF